MRLKLVNLLSLMCILQNFDDVLTPIDHVSRNPNDTYYVDKDTVRPMFLDVKACTHLHLMSTCIQACAFCIHAQPPFPCLKWPHKLYALAQYLLSF